ncbi:class I SAM-dependent methyltransferase [Saccharomonospora saliphila]|uniref:class I SAM-dependent methyltransferase n=1 Tax=Saccharomonospora saliphila TaxID=369829 RepID=UPI0003736496|nr:methyltransferase domain-containing protein [Saccharomonospora saliphila]
MPAPTTRRDLSLFLTAALRRPGLVGAVAPSSGSLGELLTVTVPRRGRPTVVELGAGSGAVSRVVGDRLPAGGRHLAVEIDPELAAHLTDGCPDLTVLCGDAARLRSMLGTVEVSHVDAVVSGLPWSLFTEDTQRRVLEEVSGALAPGGGFSTFAYRHAARLPGARRFRHLLDEYFDEVVVTRTVWRNVPPAQVYVCRRPVGHDPAT